MEYLVPGYTAVPAGNERGAAAEAFLDASGSGADYVHCVPGERFLNTFRIGAAERNWHKVPTKCTGAQFANHISSHFML
jgi:hypothetical protein